MAARLGWLAACGLMVAIGARAQTAAAPSLAEGDSWTYEDTVEIGTNFRQTHQEVTVEHAGESSVAVTIRTVGSSAPAHDVLTNPDWSRSRSVNGQTVMVNQPLNFPLRVGKAWVVDYTESNPNRAHLSEHYHTPFKVVGWEDVTVAAGTFHALKIESEGDWTAVVAPNVTADAVTRVDRSGATAITQTNRTGTSTESGRTFKAFWYAPQVKRWVKSVEEYYGPTGNRNSSYKDELLLFKVAG